MSIGSNTGVSRGGFSRTAATWCGVFLILAGCGSAGADATDRPSPFTAYALISGVVLENVTACEVDAACFLLIEFADTSVVALYGTGERPAPACDMSTEVSDAAFQVQPGEVVDVVISTCGAEGYYLQRLVRAAGQGPRRD